MIQTAVLRTRLLAVITTSSVLATAGCGSTTAVSASTTPETTGTGSQTVATASPDVPLAASQSVAPDVTQVAISTPVPPLQCAGGRPSDEDCIAPDDMVNHLLLSQDDRPGVRRPPPTAEQRAAAERSLDANHCAPRASISNGCCVAASTGPYLKAGKCCYSFCTTGCCGRPFISQGIARVAAAAMRGDWLVKEQTADLGALGEADRCALRSAWLVDALAEHASIASFARFTLDLLALGAPADLVAAAQSASLDEVEHARSCFSLVSRYGRESVGPGPLSMEGALVRVSLADAVAAAIHEGCVGETVAAMIAWRQFEVARDSQVRQTLRRIAEDESRHAETAWRFVAWALAGNDPDVHFAARRAFEAVVNLSIEAPAGPPEGVSLATWHDHGRLSESEWRAVASETLSDIVMPCVQSLCAGLFSSTAVSPSFAGVSVTG